MFRSLLLLFIVLSSACLEARQHRRGLGASSGRQVELNGKTCNLAFPMLSNPELLHHCPLHKDFPDDHKCSGDICNCQSCHEGIRQVMKEIREYTPYPISNADFILSENSTAHGLNGIRLMRALKKAQEPAKNGDEPVNIFVFGSSMTLGANCETPCNDKLEMCAWPARLEHTLNHIPVQCDGASVDDVVTETTSHNNVSAHHHHHTLRKHQRRGFVIHNKAAHGHSSGTWATFGFGNTSAMDIAIIDCAANDRNDHIGIKDLSIYTETIIRSLLALPSAPAIIYLSTYSGSQRLILEQKRSKYPFTGMPCAEMGHQDHYYPVTSHYGVPIVSYRDLAMKGGACRFHLAGGFAHATWRVHQLVADTMAHFIVSQGIMAMTTDNHDVDDEKKIHIPPPVHSLTSLEGTSLCTIATTSMYNLENRPVLSHLDPVETIKSDGRQHGIGILEMKNEGWECYDDTSTSATTTNSGKEDRHRYGWIATKLPAVMEISVKTSLAGSIGITYLCSYEGFSGALLTIDNHSYTISTNVKGIQSSQQLPNNGVITAKWDDHFSLPSTLMIRRLPRGVHNVTLHLLAFNDLRLGGKSHEDNGKFKVLDITTC